MSAAPPAETLRGTVVFTDIAGFTEFTAVKGDHEALALLAKQEALVQEELPSSAWLVKTMGDGLLFWFPEASVALCTMARLQQRFDDYAFETGDPLWVRIGAHTGAQLRTRDDIVGHDVNLASRICGMAAPSEFLISEATLRAAPSAEAGLDVAEIGPAVLKGIPEPVRIYRVAGRR
ncbi:MAG: adenylate/guanylate cyclase domain-containing protein [Dehalococcoidia bacterium]